MEPSQIIEKKLYCPTLYGEMEEALRNTTEITVGKLAIVLLEQNNLTRGHLSTPEFFRLQKRVKIAAWRSNRMETRVEIIDKNQHTIITPIKSCLD